jgi:hypothetical protein
MHDLIEKTALARRATARRLIEAGVKFCVSNVTEFPEPEIVAQFAAPTFRLCRVVMRGSEGATAVREIRRHRYGREVSGMSDLNWISAANAHHPHQLRAKVEQIFALEASSRSPQFWRAVNASVKTLHNATANDTQPDTFGSAGEAAMIDGGL